MADRTPEAGQFKSENDGRKEIKADRAGGFQEGRRTFFVTFW